MTDGGLSDRDVLRFGGASRENPGISEGFHGFGRVTGELGRIGARFFSELETDLETEGEEITDLTEVAVELVTLEPVIGLRVGVAALGTELDAGIEDLVGVEDLMVDLEVGVIDLGGATGFVEVKVEREVGVADLAGFDVVDVILDDEVEVDLVDVANDGLVDTIKVGLDCELTV